MFTSTGSKCQHNPLPVSIQSSKMRLENAPQCQLVEVEIKSHLHLVPSSRLHHIIGLQHTPRRMFVTGRKQLSFNLVKLTWRRAWGKQFVGRCCPCRNVGHHPALPIPILESPLGGWRRGAIVLLERLINATLLPNCGLTSR